MPSRRTSSAACRSDCGGSRVQARPLVDVFGSQCSTITTTLRTIGVGGQDISEYGHPTCGRPTVSDMLSSGSYDAHVTVFNLPVFIAELPRKLSRFPLLTVQPSAWPRMPYEPAGRSRPPSFAVQGLST